MKLDILFSQFLYQHKQLTLPGIGTFILDPAAAIPDEADKQKFPVTGITFEQKSIGQIDDTLVDFVRAHTGKIRPLAVSDIESYISLSTQLLNIGNPLHIDGIGTLIKGNDSRLVFTPGNYIATRIEDLPSNRENAEHRSHSEESHYRNEPQSNNAKKILTAIAVLITLGIIGGGAYYLYQSNAHKKTVSIDNTDTLVKSVVIDTPKNNSPVYKPDSALIAKDNIAKRATADSLAKAATVVTNSTNGTSVIYVLENTPNKSRALKRYHQLKDFGNDIRLQVNADSSNFKLYFVIPSAITDTLHIKDSLSRFFQRNVRIEHK